MSKQELIAILKAQQDNSDTEGAHAIADGALLKYINDDEIEREYDLVEKWYS